MMKLHVLLRKLIEMYLTNQECVSLLLYNLYVVQCKFLMVFLVFFVLLDAILLSYS